MKQNMNFTNRLPLDSQLINKSIHCGEFLICELFDGSKIFLKAEKI